MTDDDRAGGVAGGRGRVITNGGQNNNFAKGFGSSATQSSLTVGGSAFGHGKSITQRRAEHQPGFGAFSSADQQVVTLATVGFTRGINVGAGAGSVAAQRIQNLTSRKGRRGGPRWAA